MIFNWHIQESFQIWQKLCLTLYKKYGKPFVNFVLIQQILFFIKTRKEDWISNATWDAITEKRQDKLNLLNTLRPEK